MARACAPALPRRGWRGWRGWPTALASIASLLALLLPLPLLAAPKLLVEAPGELQALLDTHLGLAERQLDDLTGRRAVIRAAYRRIPELLATEGYFSPQISVSETGDVLHLRVNPGAQTRIARIDLQFSGPVLPQRQQALRALWSLTPDAPFRQAAWEAAKQELLADLIARDFPEAHIVDSEALIDPEQQQAVLTVHYDSGPRHRFGELQISGLGRYSPELLARYNRSVLLGAPWREDRVLALQAELQATPYFSAVAIERLPGISTAPGEETSPLGITVHEKAPYRAGFGVGFSSNTGARVEANYHNTDLMRRAWELSSGVRLEQRRQTLWSDVFLPPGAARQQDSVGGVFENNDIQGLRTEKRALGAIRTLPQNRLPGFFPQSLTALAYTDSSLRASLHWLSEYQDTGLSARTNRALTPNLQWSGRAFDSELRPSQGLAMMAQIGGAARSVLSDQNFIRLHGRAQRILPLPLLGKADTLSLRGELGATLAPSRDGIPQDWLFRAGGSQSVRGYAYQSMGIHEGNAVLGGRYLGTLSAEYTHWLDEKKGVALFIDSGNASDKISELLSPAVGIGVGGRWNSPAGPLAIDLAWGMRSQALHLHFSLAIPF